MHCELPSGRQISSFSWLSVGPPCGRSWFEPWLDQHSGSLNKRVKKCCLFNYNCKWLDFPVFSIKRVGPVSQFFIVHDSAGRKRTHALFEKSRTRSSQCCGLALLWAYDPSGVCCKALRSHKVDGSHHIILPFASNQFPYRFHSNHRQ